jgi:hypothetical protein
MVRRIAKRSADMALWRKCVLSERESLHGMDQVATLAEAGPDPVGYSRGVEMEYLSLGQDFSRTHSRQPGVSDVRNLRVGLFIRPLSTGRCRSVLSLIGYLLCAHSTISRAAKCYAQPALPCGQLRQSMGLFAALQVFAERKALS